jgi:hypothetical protein
MSVILAAFQPKRATSMDTYTPALQRGFVSLSTPWRPRPDAATLQRDAALARSQINVSQWRCYLPEDCIATMIQMGWDVST